MRDLFFYSWDLFQVNDLKKRLLSQFGDIQSISDSTILRFLKSDMRWSFKKLEKKPAPSLTETSYKKVLKSSMIQQRLNELEVEIIYIDEFMVNTRSFSFRGWSKRGSKGFLKVDNRAFSMTFIWGLSAKRVYGLMGSDGSITSDEIILYIKELWLAREGQLEPNDSDFVIVFDNAKVHTSSKTL